MLPCGGCSLSFEDSAARNEHRAEHNTAYGTLQGVCVVCGMEFSDFWLFFDHFEASHPEHYEAALVRADQCLEDGIEAAPARILWLCLTQVGYVENPFMSCVNLAIETMGGDISRPVQEHVTKRRCEEDATEATRNKRRRQTEVLVDHGRYNLAAEAATATIQPAQDALHLPLTLLTPAAAVPPSQSPEPKPENEDAPVTAPAPVAGRAPGAEEFDEMMRTQAQVWESLKSWKETYDTPDAAASQAAPVPPAAAAPSVPAAAPTPTITTTPTITRPAPLILRLRSQPGFNPLATVKIEEDPDVIYLGTESKKSPLAPKVFDMAVQTSVRIANDDDEEDLAAETVDKEAPVTPTHIEPARTLTPLPVLSITPPAPTVAIETINNATAREVVAPALSTQAPAAPAAPHHSVAYDLSPASEAALPPQPGHNQSQPQQSPPAQQPQVNMLQARNLAYFIGQLNLANQQKHHHANRQHPQQHQPPRDACFEFWNGNGGLICPECPAGTSRIFVNCSPQTMRNHVLRDHYRKYYERVELRGSEETKRLERLIGHYLGSTNKDTKRVCLICPSRPAFKGRKGLGTHLKECHNETFVTFQRQYHEQCRDWIPDDSIQDLMKQ